MNDNIYKIIVEELEKKLQDLDWEWGYEQEYQLDTVKEFHLGRWKFGDYIEQGWFDEWGGSQRKREMEEFTPIFEIVDSKFETRMDAIFGNLWRDVFKLWMNEKFDLQIKTIWH